MRATTRRYRLGYVLGGVLCLIGTGALLILAWTAYAGIVAADDPVSAFWSYLWNAQFSSLAGFQFRPVFLLVLAGITVGSGLVVFAFSRQRFFLPGKTVALRCPFCRKLWTATHDGGQVLCPYCNHLIHPKIMEK
jgi:uncharacterized Zn-finger protein